MEWQEQEVIDDSVYDYDGNLQRHKQIAKVIYLPAAYPRQMSRVGQQRGMNSEIGEASNDYDAYSSTQSKSKTQNKHTYGSSPAMKSGLPNQSLVIFKDPSIKFKSVSQGNDPRFKSGSKMDDFKS